MIEQWRSAVVQTKEMFKDVRYGLQQVRAYGGGGAAPVVSAVGTEPVTKAVRAGVVSGMKDSAQHATRRGGRFGSGGFMPGVTQSLDAAFQAARLSIRGFAWDIIALLGLTHSLADSVNRLKEGAKLLSNETRLVGVSTALLEKAGISMEQREEIKRFAVIMEDFTGIDFERAYLLAAQSAVALGNIPQALGVVKLAIDAEAAGIVDSAESAVKAFSKANAENLMLLKRMLSNLGIKADVDNFSEAIKMLSDRISGIAEVSYKSAGVMAAYETAYSNYLKEIARTSGGINAAMESTLALKSLWDSMLAGTSNFIEQIATWAMNMEREISSGMETDAEIEELWASRKKQIRSKHHEGAEYFLKAVSGGVAYPFRMLSALVGKSGALAKIGMGIGAEKIADIISTYTPWEADVLRGWFPEAEGKMADINESQKKIRESIKENWRKYNEINDETIKMHDDFRIEAEKLRERRSRLKKYAEHPQGVSPLDRPLPMEQPLKAALGRLWASQQGMLPAAVAQEIMTAIEKSPYFPNLTHEQEVAYQTLRNIAIGGRGFVIPYTDKQIRNLFPGVPVLGGGEVKAPVSAQPISFNATIINQGGGRVVGGLSYAR